MSASVEHSPGPSRRSLLAAGAVTATAGAAAALTLTPMTFAEASPPRNGTTRTKMITGHLRRGAADFVYLPVRVPRGVSHIAVAYSYSKPVVPTGALSNACDIGIFDQRGVGLGSRGFRGWSGGARTEFEISASDATPGYLPGPVEAGTWHVVLGPYTVATVGLDYEVQVTLTFGPDGAPFRPDYPPQSIKHSGPGWYRGDSHLHTVYSDGTRTPAQVAQRAREGRLDFIVTTDHNTSSAHGAYGPYAGDDLLIITGEEVTTRNGHYLALGIEPGTWIDWRYRATDDVWGRFTDQIHRRGGIAVPAHPYGTCIACRWKFGYLHADAVEVWNGVWGLDDESSVETWDAKLVESARRGTGWLPAMGNSDAHSEPAVVGLPQTVVRADALSARAITGAIAAGRSWICESADIDLRFTLAGGGRRAEIGERLPADPAAELTASVDVVGVPNGLVRFISDEGPTTQVTLPASGRGTATWTTTPQNAAYVRVEVRHPLPAGSDLVLGPMAALTNPIWLGRG